MNNRVQHILIGVCVIAAIAFVGYEVFLAPAIRTYPPGSVFIEQARLTELTTNGVRVVLFLDSDSQGQPLLRATFTPTQSGFHLYGKDLDPETVGGRRYADEIGIASALLAQGGRTGFCRCFTAISRVQGCERLSCHLS